MDTGILIAGVMGAHSGNILNGDFSIGLSPGVYVEKGEIRGHVKDAMVAGNIFDTMTISFRSKIPFILLPEACFPPSCSTA